MTTSLRTQVIENADSRSQLYLDWEALVSGSPSAGIMQSLRWAQFKRRQGLVPLHIGVFKDELVGGAIFYTAQNTNGAGILVAPEGPVLPLHDANLSALVLQAIMVEAENYARAVGVMAMRIEPRLASPLPRMFREFARAPVDLVPRQTLYLDLSMSEDDILKQMKPKGRYNISVSQRRGVEIIEDRTASGVARFYTAVKEASRRDDFALEPHSFFEHLAASLCPSGNARFIFAQHEGDLLGALLLLTYGQRATYLYGGITNCKRNLMGGYALQWAAIKAAQEAGCTTYDFYGFNEFRSPLHPYSRFSQFKSQFGGQVTRFAGAQDCFFIDCLADAFIKAVNESCKNEPIVSSDAKKVECALS